MFKQLFTGLSLMATLASIATPSLALDYNARVCNENAHVFLGTLNDLRYGHKIANGSRVQVVETVGGYSRFLAHDMDTELSSQWLPSSDLCSYTPQVRQHIDEYVNTYHCGNNHQEEAFICFHNVDGNILYLHQAIGESDSNLMATIDFRRNIEGLTLNDLELGSVVLVDGNQSVINSKNQECLSFLITEGQARGVVLIYCGFGKSEGNTDVYYR